MPAKPEPVFQDRQHPHVVVKNTFLDVGDDCAGTRVRELRQTVSCSDMSPSGMQEAPGCILLSLDQEEASPKVDDKNNCSSTPSGVREVSASSVMPVVLPFPELEALGLRPIVRNTFVEVCAVTPPAVASSQPRSSSWPRRQWDIDNSQDSASVLSSLGGGVDFQKRLSEPLSGVADTDSTCSTAGTGGSSDGRGADKGSSNGGAPKKSEGQSTTRRAGRRGQRGRGSGRVTTPPSDRGSAATTGSSTPEQTPERRTVMGGHATKAEHTTPEKVAKHDVVERSKPGLHWGPAKGFITPGTLPFWSSYGKEWSGARKEAYMKPWSIGNPAADMTAKSRIRSFSSDSSSSDDSEDEITKQWLTVDPFRVRLLPHGHVDARLTLPGKDRQVQKRYSAPAVKVSQ